MRRNSSEGRAGLGCRSPATAASSWLNRRILSGDLKMTHLDAYLDRPVFRFDRGTTPVLGPCPTASLNSPERMIQSLCLLSARG